MTRLTLARALTLCAALAACTPEGPGKEDPPTGTDTGGGTDTPPVTEPDPTYSASLTLDASRVGVGEEVRFTAELLQDGEPLSATVTLSSDLGELSVEGDSLSTQVLGTHTLTARLVADGVPEQTARATLEVVPGAPVRVDLILDQPSTTAGVSVGFRAQGFDAQDNPVPGALVFAESEVTIDGDQVSATQVGRFQVTAVLGSLSDAEWLEVLPGPAVSLDLQLDDAPSEVGDSALATVALADAFGNPVAGSPTLTVEGVPATVAGEVITFEGEGFATVVATYDTLEDREGPFLIDSSGPLLTLFEPAHGAFQTSGAVRVAGQVVDPWGSAPPTLTVAGQVVPLGPDGSFSVDLEAPEGIFTAELLAIDEAGDLSTEQRSVQLGPALPWGSVQGSSLIIRLDEGEGSLDVVEDLAEGLIVEDEIVALIPSPIIDESERTCLPIIGCIDWYALTLDIEDPTWSSTTVTIDPLFNGNVRVKFKINNPELDWVADGLLLGVPVSGTGSVTATNVEVSMDLDPGVSRGQLTLDMVSVTTTTRQFEVEIDGWLQDLLDVFSIDLADLTEALVLQAVEDAVVAEVPPLLETTLATLVLEVPVPLGETVTTLVGEPTTFIADSFGLEVTLASEVDIGPWTNPLLGPGHLSVGYSRPDLTDLGAVNLVLSLDGLNQVLYGAWGASLLDLELAADDLGIDPGLLLLFAPGAVDPQIRLQAWLPPVLVPNDDPAYPFLLQLGDLKVEIGDPGAPPALSGWVAGTAGIALDASDGTSIALVPGPVELSVHVDSPAGLVGVDALLEPLIPALLPELTGALAFELPSLEGFRLEEVSVGVQGDDGGHVHLNAQLAAE